MAEITVQEINDNIRMKGCFFVYKSDGVLDLTKEVKCHKSNALLHDLPSGFNYCNLDLAAAIIYNKLPDNIRVKGYFHYRIAYSPYNNLFTTQSFFSLVYS